MRTHNSISNALTYLQPKSLAAGAALLWGATTAAARQIDLSAASSDPVIVLPHAHPPVGLAPAPAPGPASLVSALVPPQCQAFVTAAAGCVADVLRYPWFDAGDLFTKYGVGGLGGSGQALCDTVTSIAQDCVINPGRGVYNRLPSLDSGPTPDPTPGGGHSALLLLTVLPVFVGVCVGTVLLRRRRLLRDGQTATPMARPRVPAQVRMCDVDTSRRGDIELAVREGGGVLVVTHPSTSES